MVVIERRDVHQWGSKGQLRSAPLGGSRVKPVPVCQVNALTLPQAGTRCHLTTSGFTLESTTAESMHQSQASSTAAANPRQCEASTRHATHKFFVRRCAADSTLIRRSSRRPAGRARGEEFVDSMRFRNHRPHTIACCESVFDARLPQRLRRGKKTLLALFFKERMELLCPILFILLFSTTTSEVG